MLLTACSPDIDALRTEGDVQGLIDALDSDESAELRADAARALGELSASEAVDPLVAALTDDEVAVREAAAEALARLGDAHALLPLLRATQDEAAAVQRAAETAFATLLDDVNSGQAAALLVNGLTDENETLRARAAQTLGTLGDDAAILPLLRAADHDLPEVRQFVESALVSLLTSVDRQAALAALEDALAEEDATVRVAAVEALGIVYDPAAILPLLQASGDESAEVRDAAQRVLANLVSELSEFDSVPPLVTALGDADPAVAGAADAALRELVATIGPERSLPALSAAGASDAWLALALGVPEEQLAAETRRLGIQLEPLEVIESTVAVVRDGTPVPGAHRYASSDAFHPAVVLQRMREFDETSPWELARVAWAPTAVRFVELIVIEDEIVWEELEVCLYNGPSITRYRAHQTVRVVSAIDAQVVAEQSYTGSDPRLCQATEPYDLTVLYGEAPDLSAAIPWLESLINPPGP